MKSTTRPPLIATTVTVGLIVASVIAGLLISEVILRVMPTKPRIVYREVNGDKLHQFDKTLGWRQTPNAKLSIKSPEYHINASFNSMGIRGPEIPPAEADECRILIIGDSFVAGLTVDYEASFGQVLQRLLDNSENHSCRVISVGVEGYSTDQELLLVENVTLGLSPTLTILFFYFNDVHCNLLSHCEGYNKPVFLQANNLLELSNVPVPENIPKPVQRKAKPKVVSIQETEPANVSIKNWLMTHSFLYRFLRREVKIALGLQSRIPLRSGMFLSPLPERYHVFRSPYNEITHRAWDMTEKLIINMSQTVKDNGSEFMLFHIPMRETIHHKEWIAGLKAHNLDEESLHKDQVEKELRRICADNNLDCIFPAKLFRKLTESQGANKRFYLTNDPHWNEAGHNLVGHILAESILGR